MNNRTISILRDILEGKVYFYLKDRETCRQFYEQAEAEGFMFGNIRPTDSLQDDIIAIYKNHKLGHVGFAGHLAFHNPSSVSEGLTRIDYAEYVAGESDFYYKQ